MHGFYRKSGRNADVQTKQEKVSPEGARRICSSAADLGLILCEGGAGNTCMVLSRRICAKADKRCGEVRMRIVPDGRKEKNKEVVAKYEQNSLQDLY